MRRGAVSALVVWALLSIFPRSALPQNLEFERDRARMMLDRVSHDIQKNFYDENLRGLDWKALTAQARERIEKAKSVDAIYTAIFALVDRLEDSHTKFLPPRRAARIRFGFEAKPFGEKVFIYEVKDKSAAEGAGLRPGDQLLSINNFKVERATFDLMMLYFRALQPVTAMEMTVVRAGEPPRRLRLEARVQPEAVLEDLTKLDNIYKLIREAEAEEERPRYLLTEDGIGYLWLPDFTMDPGDLDGLVKKVAKARAVIVDLRQNLGGRVDTLARFVGFFTPEATTMADIVRRNKTEPIKIKPQKPNLLGPVFILTDSESSSAAEMFARHFQRTRRGVVIGDRSSGRVTAARFYSGSIGTDTVVPYGLQIAVGRVVFPGGEELENRGVTPDQTCLPTGEDLRERRDPCRALAHGLAQKALTQTGKESEKE